MTNSFDLIVLGAGVSGAALAARSASKGARVLLLEREREAGGSLCTHVSGEGFWLELGAHTLYNSYVTLLELLALEPGEAWLEERRNLKYLFERDGELHSAFSQLSLFELLTSLPRALGARKEGRSMREHYEPIVGRRNYERVLSPMFAAALLGREVDELPASMLFKSRPRRDRRFPRKLAPRGGMRSVISRLLCRREIELRTSAEAVSMVRDGALFEVTTAGGQQFRAPYAALALPPDSAARLLSASTGLDGTLSGTLAQLLGEIRTREVQTLGAVVKSSATSLRRVAGLVSLDRSYYSVVARDPIPNPSLRGFALHLDPRVHPEEGLAKLAKLVGVTPPQFESFARKLTSLPSPALGHERLVQRVDELLSTTPLAIAGNWFGGISIEDCAIRAVSEAERLARQAGW